MVSFLWMSNTRSMAVCWDSENVFIFFLFSSRVGMIQSYTRGTWNDAGIVPVFCGVFGAALEDKCRGCYNNAKFLENIIIQLLVVFNVHI